MKSPTQAAAPAPPSLRAAGDPGEGIDFLFCLVRTAVLGMMGNVVRGARPPPRPQTVSESVGVSGATPESRRRVEEGKSTEPEGRGEEGFKTPAGKKRKKKKVEVFSFLPSHFANFGGRPQRGNVTQTSLSEIGFAFVFAEDFTRPIPHPVEGLGSTKRRASWV